MMPRNTLTDFLVRLVTGAAALARPPAPAECTFHYVTSTDAKPKDEFKTVKGPYEILNAGGIIAGGEPHIHISIAREGQAATGGHLEKGCKILYLGELTIYKYAAQPLTRRPNAHGVGILQAK